MLIDELTTKNKWLKHITTNDQAGNGCWPALKWKKNDPMFLMQKSLIHSNFQSVKNTWNHIRNNIYFWKRNSTCRKDQQTSEVQEIISLEICTNKVKYGFWFYSKLIISSPYDIYWTFRQVLFRSQIMSNSRNK